jgi:ribosomal protein L11 methyltransferase
MGSPGPRRWLVVSVDPAGAPDPLVVVDALRRAGARAVEREGSRLAAYLLEPGDPRRALARVRRAVAAVAPGAAPAIEWRWESYTAWAERRARDTPAVRRVGERIAVLRAGAPDDAPAGTIPLRLHPGVAFGAADHPTTRACLRLIEPLVRPGARIADVGSGTGILAIAAVLLGARSAVALEADPLACDDARRNVAANGLQRRVRVVRRRVRPGDFAGRSPFDGIAANVEFGVLHELLPDLRGALRPDGWLVVSGVVGDEPRALRKAAVGAGLAVRGEAVEAGWWAGAFRRTD